MRGREAPHITVRGGRHMMVRAAPAMPVLVAVLSTAPAALDILDRAALYIAGQVARLTTVPVALPMMGRAVRATRGRVGHAIRAPAAPESSVHAFAGSGFSRALRALVA